MIGKKLKSILTALLCTAAIVTGTTGVICSPINQVSAASIKNEELKLIPGGVPFGVKLYCEGVLVVGLAEIKSSGTEISPARDAGVKIKDIITCINGEKVVSVDEVVNAVADCQGAPLNLTLKRGSSEINVEITPVASDEDGKYKTGLWIRDSTAGIGTVTFINPETGSFAGLGHGICDADTGELMPLMRGIVVNVSINGVVKGQAGSPGELKGYFSSGKIGSLIGNTDCGVYGIFAEFPSGALDEAIPVASHDKIVEGEAEIYCTTDSGGIGRYKVNISNIDHSGREIKNFVVTVTDEALLARTGGIVQGMSGSPIIQNGCIVGAVTHVLINNPTKGYGIFIENMLANLPSELQ